MEGPAGEIVNTGRTFLAQTKLKTLLVLDTV
jgi:hypothetical protein